jgi:hypothetical protein
VRRVERNVAVVFGVPLVVLIDLSHRAEVDPFKDQSVGQVS